MSTENNNTNTQKGKELFTNLEGLWIPKEHLLNPELSLQEAVLLSSIQNLSKSGECHASNHYFAELLGLSKKRVEGVVKRLSDSGYITRRFTYKENSKQIDKRYIKLTNPPLKNEDTPPPKSEGTPPLKNEGDNNKEFHSKAFNNKDSITHNISAGRNDMIFIDSLGDEFSYCRIAMKHMDRMKEQWGLENIYTGSQTQQTWNECEEALENLINSDTALCEGGTPEELISSYLENLYERRGLERRPNRIGLPFMLCINSENPTLLETMIDPNYGGMLDEEWEDYDEI
ncbi:MAG: helix-turn-helix domain-containing protein [Pseudomonadota bacterium]